MTMIEVEKRATLTGHKDCIYVLEKGPEGKFFSGAGDGMVVVWNLDNPELGQLIVRVPNSVYALSYHSPDESLLVGHNFEGVHLIDLETKKEIASAAVTQSAIFDIKTFEDKVYVATGNGEIIILSFPELKVIQKINASNNSARSIAVNRNKNEFAVGFSDNSFRIYDLKNFKLLKEQKEAHKNSIFTLNYSPDYKYLLTGSRDAHLKVWEAENSYQLTKSVVAHMFAINNVAYSEDGKFFATCSMDKSIKVWNASQFKLLKVIDKARHAGHGTSVNKLVWLNNNTLVSCSDDRAITIWNIKNL